MMMSDVTEAAEVRGTVGGDPRVAPTNVDGTEGVTTATATPGDGTTGARHRTVPHANAGATTTISRGQDGGRESCDVGGGERSEGDVGWVGDV